MEEIWKDIPDYEGLYQASNLGRVRSLGQTQTRSNGRAICEVHIKGKILKPSLDGTKRYYGVSLCKNKKIKRHMVHRLIAKTFLDNPNNYIDVNHKDENKQNNRLENLEWCTHSYNVSYSKHKNKDI